jgi:HEAT repeat protein
MMGVILVVAVGIRLYQKSQEVTLAQRLLAPNVWFGTVDPKKLFTEQELVTALGDRNPAVHNAAYWALDASGSSSPALVRALIDQLESESEEEWFQSRRDFRHINVVASLKRINVRAPKLARLLVKAMASNDRWVRLRATEVLCDAAGRPGPADQGVARLLLQALRDTEARIRIPAAEALVGLDPATRRQAVAVLLGQLRDSEPPRAFEAVLGLALFDPEANEAVTILTDRLEKGNATDLLTNLYLLGRLGPMARPAVPVVLRTMMSRDAERSQPFFLNKFALAYTGWHFEWRS